MKEKLKNQITINLSDEYRNMIQYLSEYYNRLPAELVRLLLLPILRKEYALIMKEIHPENNEPWKVARFKED